MDSFLAFCSICCILILSTDGVTLTFEMKSIMPVKGSSLEFSCMLELFNSDSILILIETSEVTRCNADNYHCNFKAGYSFTVNTTGVYGVISNLTTEAAGTWSCRYIKTTTVLAYSNTWNVIVYIQVEGITLYDGSSAVVLSVLSVVEGVSITVNCQTTLSRPASVIIWYKGDNVVRDGVTTTNLTSNGLDFVRSYLTLTPTNIDHGLYIYCQAYNLDPIAKVTSVRATVQVKVYVTSITMSPSGSSLIFLEGQEKSIQSVTSPSRPRPQVRWWLGTEQVLDKITESESSSGNLIVTNSEISLTLNRSYTHKVLYCEATVSGQQTWISSTKSHVTLEYAPDVRVNISGSTVVGFTVVLMCTAQGEPSQYTFHPWIHRAGQTEVRRLNGVNTDSISILTLSNTSIQDMGSYICTVNNSITGLDGQFHQTGDTSLYVQGPPVIGEIGSIFKGEIGKSATIEIPFYSSSSTTTVKFIKHFDSFVISNTSNFSIYIFPSIITLTFYTEKVMMPGHVAVLFFQNVRDKDFVHYKIQLSNEKGNVTMGFDFLAKDSMYAPSLSDSSPVCVSVGGAVGLGVGCFVLGCIVTFIAFTIRRQLNVSKNSCFRSKGNTDDATPTYSNTEMTSQPVKPIYEELNKGNLEHNMYDKIEHSADGT